jgi:hypothetical protein
MRRPIRIACVATVYALIGLACTHNFDVFDQPFGTDASQVEDGTLPESANGEEPSTDDGISLDSTPSDTGSQAADQGTVEETSGDDAVDRDTAQDGIDQDAIDRDAFADASSEFNDAPVDVSSETAVDSSIDSPSDAVADAVADVGPDAVSCGSPGQRCCSGNACHASACCNAAIDLCFATTSCQSCGASGESCCSNGPKCATGPCRNGKCP